MSKAQLGAKSLNINTKGRLKCYSTEYNENCVYTWKYDKIKSTSYVYVFRGFTTYIDAEGKKDCIYTPQIYQSIDSLLENTYIYESN